MMSFTRYGVRPGACNGRRMKRTNLRDRCRSTLVHSQYRVGPPGAIDIMSAPFQDATSVPQQDWMTALANVRQAFGRRTTYPGTIPPDIPRNAKAAVRSVLLLERASTGSGVQRDGPVGRPNERFRFSNSLATAADAQHRIKATPGLARAAW